MLSHSRALELGLLGEANTNDVAADLLVYHQFCIWKKVSTTNKGYQGRDRRHDMRADLPPTSNFATQLMVRLSYSKCRKSCVGSHYTRFSR